MTNQDHDDLVQLANRSLATFARTAANVSAQALEQDGDTGNLARLAIALHQLAASFSTRQVHGLRGLQERCPLAVLLQHFERIAQASPTTAIESSSGYSVLRKVACLRIDDGEDVAKIENDCEQGWRHYAQTEPGKRLLEIVDQVQQQVDSLPDDEDDDFDEVDPFEAPPEYPAHINDKLYEALSRQTRCDCRAATGTSDGFCHAARLSLTPTFKPADGDHHPFDMIFSTGLEVQQPDSYRWQWIRILMPWKSKPKSQELLSSLRTRLGNLALPSLSKESQHLMCDRANSHSRHRIPLRYQDCALHAAEDLRQARVEHNVVSHSGYTLKQILSGRPSFKTRACLAYIVAKSVWQYYNSRWMSQPWSHRDLVFMQEDDTGPHGRVICEPFLLTGLEESVIHATLEMRHRASAKAQCRIPRDGLLHRHPIILALGIVLLEIGTEPDSTEGKSSYHDLHHWDGRQWDTATINDLFLAAAPLGEQLGSAATDTIKRKYFRAVQACFRPDLFEDCEFIPNDPEQGREERRNIIYREIVYRLRKLVEGAGWLCSWPEHRSVDISALAPQSDLEFFAAEIRMRSGTSISSSAQHQSHIEHVTGDAKDRKFMSNAPNHKVQRSAGTSVPGIPEPHKWSNSLRNALHKTSAVAAAVPDFSQASESNPGHGAASAFYYIHSYSQYEAEKVNVQHVDKNKGVMAGSGRKINFDRHDINERRTDEESSASSNAG